MIDCYTSTVECSPACECSDDKLLFCNGSEDSTGSRAQKEHIYFKLAHKSTLVNKINEVSPHWQVAEIGLLHYKLSSLQHICWLTTTFHFLTSWKIFWLVIFFSLPAISKWTKTLILDPTWKAWQQAVRRNSADGHISVTEMDKLMLPNPATSLHKVHWHGPQNMTFIVWTKSTLN